MTERIRPRFGPDDARAGQVFRPVDENVGRLEPLPGREECDFCGGGPIVFLYGCGNATIDTTIVYDEHGLGSEDHNTVGAWAACAACKFLVDRSEVKKLGDRCAREVLTRLAAEHPGASLPTRATMRRDLIKIQQTFWKNRRRSEDREFVRRGHGDRRR